MNKEAHMNVTLIRKLTLISALLGSAAAYSAPLTVTVYNPGSKGIFPVSSEIVSGEKESILIDAQFGVGDGQALVDMLKKSGKKLTTIFISGGDPDYYFGLEPLKAAFPDVKIVASQYVVDHIKQTKDAKLAYWGPILNSQAPKSLIVPDVLTQPTLTLEGQRIEIKEMNTPNAYLWAPSIKTAFGGVLISYGQHVWMADSQTPAVRSQWVKALNHLLDLKPKRVVPGHFVGTEPKGSKAVQFTRDYVLKYEAELSKAKNSAALIHSMKQVYPTLPVDDGLAIGAKVNTGEMKW
jgi:glyoxylase-like metal-dependent hydrolase (beta-lactamase superfamily II)